MRLNIPRADLLDIYERVSRKQVSTAIANEKLEEQAEIYKGNIPRPFVQVPLPIPEKSKLMWLLYARLWLALRSPTWETRTADEIIIEEASFETVKKTLIHVRSLIDDAQHRPRNQRWCQYLERAQAILERHMQKATLMDRV